MTLCTRSYNPSREIGVMFGNQLSYIVVPTLYNHHPSSYARGFVVSPCSPWTLPAWGTWRHDPWWQRNSTRAAAWGRTSRSRRWCGLDRPGSAWWESRVGFGSKIWGYTKSPSHVIFDGDNLIMLEVSCFQTNLFVVNEMLYGHRFLTHSQSRTQLDESPKTETCFFGVMTGQTSWWNHNYLGINLAVESLIISMLFCILRRLEVSSSENMISFMTDETIGKICGHFKHHFGWSSQISLFVESLSSLVTNDLSVISEDIPWFSTCSSGVRPPQWLPHNVVCAQVSRAHPAERLRDAQRLSHHPGHHIAGESTKWHRDLHLTWRGFAFWGGERVEIEFGDIIIINNIYISIVWIHMGFKNYLKCIY